MKNTYLEKIMYQIDAICDEADTFLIYAREGEPAHVSIRRSDCTEVYIQNEDMTALEQVDTLH